MRTLGLILLVMLVLSSSGCMTYSSVQRANGKDNVVTGHHPTEPQAAYYALLPLSVPTDIATSPIQLVLYLFVWSSGTPL